MPGSLRHTGTTLPCPELRRAPAPTGCCVLPRAGRVQVSDAKSQDRHPTSARGMLAAAQDAGCSLGHPLLPRPTPAPPGHARDLFPGTNGVGVGTHRRGEVGSGLAGLAAGGQQPGQRSPCAPLRSPPLRSAPPPRRPPQPRAPAAPGAAAATGLPLLGDRGPAPHRRAAPGGGHRRRDALCVPPCHPQSPQSRPGSAGRGTPGDAGTGAQSPGMEERLPGDSRWSFSGRAGAQSQKIGLASPGQPLDGNPEAAVGQGAGPVNPALLAPLEGLRRRQQTSVPRGIPDPAYGIKSSLQGGNKEKNLRFSCPRVLRCLRIRTVSDLSRVRRGDSRGTSGSSSWDLPGAPGLAPHGQGLSPGLWLREKTRVKQPHSLPTEISDHSLRAVFASMQKKIIQVL